MSNPKNNARHKPMSAGSAAAAVLNQPAGPSVNPPAPNPGMIGNQPQQIPAQQPIVPIAPAFDFPADYEDQNDPMVGIQDDFGLDFPELDLDFDEEELDADEAEEALANVEQQPQPQPQQLMVDQENQPDIILGAGNGVMPLYAEVLLAEAPNLEWQGSMRPFFSCKQLAVCKPLADKPHYVQFVQYDPLKASVLSDLSGQPIGKTEMLNMIVSATTDRNGNHMSSHVYPLCKPDSNLYPQIVICGQGERFDKLVFVSTEYIGIFEYDISDFVLHGVTDGTYAFSYFEVQKEKGKDLVLNIAGDTWGRGAYLKNIELKERRGKKGIPVNGLTLFSCPDRMGRYTIKRVYLCRESTPRSRIALRLTCANGTYQFVVNPTQPRLSYWRPLVVEQNLHPRMVATDNLTLVPQPNEQL